VRDAIGLFAGNVESVNNIIEQKIVDWVVSSPLHLPRA